LKQPYTVSTNFLNTNLRLDYEPVTGLKAGVSLGYNNAQADQTLFQPIASYDPASNPFGSSSFGYNSNKNWIVEPQVTYDRLIGRGKLNVLIGGSAQQTNTNGTTVLGTGYTNDALLRTITNAPVKNATDDYGEYRYAAVFGRIGYNYESKYIINLNARRDGSSRFGPDRQFGTFGSIGVAWVFSEENFVKNTLPFLSFGKLRGSYGTTGSDAVGDYQYLTRWSSNNTFLYGGVQPLTPLQHANPDYQWQVNKKLEGGLELGFIKDRIVLNASWYRNRTDNQLIGFPTPAFTGFNSVTANSPALVQNQGWEFTFLAKVIDGSDFKWSVNFNTSFNKNKLVAYPDLAQSPYAGIYKIGFPLNMTWVYHYTGVDPATGQYTFEDVNHDGKITTNSANPGTNDDLHPFDLTPKFVGGLGMNFTYRSMQLSLFFVAKKQYARNAYDPGVFFPGGIYNLPVAELNAMWRKPGDIARVARATTQPDQSDLNFTYSDGVYTEASFIRLSNVSFSYGLPAAWVKKAGMTGCNLFVHADNLFLITNYKGLDPETQNFGGLPPVRTIVAGLSFNF
jgi:TonB-linked SusC/RagA family outer membrane protein